MLGILGCSTASAATTSQHLNLALNRSDAGASTARWDGSQRAVNARRQYAPAAFAGRSELLGGAAGDRCGMSVDTGDLNGDGLLDVVVGCATANSNAGRVDVYLRRSDNSGYLAKFSPTISVTGGCGTSVAVGDADGDGDDDVAVGCGAAYSVFVFCCYNKYRGSVSVFLGDGAGNLAAGVEAYAPAQYDGCGYSVTFERVDANASQDLVVGCLAAPDTAASGQVRVLRHNTGTSYFGATTVVSPSAVNGEQCAASLDAGDVNGDGASDVVFGCFGDDVTGTDNGSAVVALNNGFGTAFTGEAAELRHPSPGTSAKCGRDQTIAVGDTNGDGYADVLLGCEGRDPSANTNQGGAALFRRAAGGGSFLAGTSLVAPSAIAGEACGWGTAIGDIDGDGRADLAMGCASADTGTLAGATIIFLQNQDGSGTFDAGTRRTEFTTAANRNCGWSNRLADVNHDGRSDLVMGCGGSATGRVVVLDGSHTATTVQDLATEANAMCGHVVESGDFNGDGRGDLAFACEYRDGGASNAGSVSVAVRTADNTGFGAVNRLGRTPAINDNCGGAIATGDVNADGYDDIALSCDINAENGGLTAPGDVLVFLRAAGGASFDPTPKLVRRTIGDMQNLDRCGDQLELADVNGDEYADVVWGCAAGMHNGSGRAYVSIWDTTTSSFPRTATKLGRPAPLADLLNDQCGLGGLATGDVNADGRADIALGCRAGADGDPTLVRGGVVVYLRNAANTGFDYATTIYDTAPASGNACGATTNFTAGISNTISMGDVDDDGDADIIIGCGGASSNAGKSLVARSDGAGGFTTTALTPPAPVAGEYCGSGTSVGDVNGDGRADIALGCGSGYLDSAIQGRAVIFTRASGNGGFDAGSTFRHPVTSITDGNCGMGISLGDIDGDGRSDLLLGCEGDPTGSANAGSVAVASATTTGAAAVAGTTLMTSRSLTAGRERIATQVTIQRSIVLNGATGIATADVRADPGASWQTVPINVPTALVTPGRELQVRVTLPQAPNDRMVATLHDLTVAYTYLEAPRTPTLVAPASSSSTADDTPILTARFDDDDAPDTGTLQFEVCTHASTPDQTCAQAGGTLVAAGDSPGGITNGANGSWTMDPAFPAVGTYHWRARGVDQHGLTGLWSTTWSLTTTTSLTVTIADPVLALAPVMAGADAQLGTTITVSGTNPLGYDLYAADGNTGTALSCAGGGCGASTIPDWTGTFAAPSGWAPGSSGPSGFAGITVDASTTGRDPKWTPTGPAFDMRYAGLAAMPGLLHSSNSGPGPDDIDVSYRVTPSSSTSAGAYDGVVTVTVVGRF